MRCILLIIFFCVLMKPIQGNEPGGTMGYSFSLHRGQMLPHYDLMSNLNEETVFSFEANVWFLEASESRKLSPGIGYILSSMGNQEVYGRSHTVFMGISSPLFSGVLPVFLNTSLGVAYISKKYDSEINPLNRAIGSHLNAYGQLSIHTHIGLNSGLALRPGIAFHHFSNGRMVAPNQGLNLFTLNAGIAFYTSQTHAGTFLSHRDLSNYGTHHFAVVLAPGVKQIDSKNRRQVVTAGLLLEYLYMVAPEVSVGVGAGFYHNESWAYTPYAEDVKNEDVSPGQMALHFLLEKELGPFSFMFHPGFYLYKSSEQTPVYTSRLGTRYTFDNDLLVHFAIKHHWFALADYFEWGIGYRFNR